MAAPVGINSLQQCYQPQGLLEASGAGGQTVHSGRRRRRGLQQPAPQAYLELCCNTLSGRPNRSPTQCFLIQLWRVGGGGR